MRVRGAKYILFCITYVLSSTLASQEISLVVNGGFEIPDSIFYSPSRMNLGDQILRVDATDVPGWMAYDDNEIPYRTMDLEITQRPSVTRMDVFDFTDSVVAEIDLGRTSLTFNTCSDPFLAAGSESMVVSKLIAPLEPRRLYRISVDLFVLEKAGGGNFQGIDFHFIEDSLTLHSQILDSLILDVDTLPSIDRGMSRRSSNRIILANNVMGNMRIGEWQHHSVSFTVSKKCSIVSIGKYLGRLGIKCSKGWLCFVDNLSIEEVIR